MEQHVPTAPADSGDVTNRAVIRHYLRNLVIGVALFTLALAALYWNAGRVSADPDMPNAAQLGSEANAASTELVGIRATTTYSEGAGMYAPYGPEDGEALHWEDLSGRSERWVVRDPDGSLLSDSATIADQTGRLVATRVVDYAARTVTDSADVPEPVTDPAPFDVRFDDWADGTVSGIEQVDGRSAYHWERKSFTYHHERWVDVESKRVLKQSDQSVGSSYENSYRWEPTQTSADLLPAVPEGFRHIDPLPACAVGQQRGQGCD